MPKKFVGENSKAVAARARKTAAQDAETEKKQKELSEELWKEENKHALKKQQRKEEQDRKKQQNIDRKMEAKALLEQELDSIKKLPKPAAPTAVSLPPKLTRSQISENVKKAPVVRKEKEKIETHLEVPLEENINRLDVEGEEARTITEAISVLSTKDEEYVDKHPERRMKAAYTAYEDRRVKELKLDHPSLRLSQLKQMIFKEWQKAPENPFNAASV